MSGLRLGFATQSPLATVPKTLALARAEKLVLKASFFSFFKKPKTSKASIRLNCRSCFMIYEFCYNL